MQVMLVPFRKLSGSLFDTVAKIIDSNLSFEMPIKAPFVNRFDRFQLTGLKSSGASARVILSLTAST